jgi:hypothetical protein
MGGACSTYGERGGLYKVSVGKRKEKAHWGDRHRWEDTIKIDVQEVVFRSMD